MLGSWPAATTLPAVNSAPSLTNSDIDPVLSCRMTYPMAPSPTANGKSPPSLDQRQLVVLVERRRRRQRPFERGGACPPWIVCRPLLAHERLGDAEEEHQRAKPRKVGSERGDQVPAGESVGIVGDAPRHAGEPEEVLREEDDVDADKGEPEVQLADRLRVHVAAHLWKPVVPAGKDGEDGPKRE